MAQSDDLSLQGDTGPKRGGDQSQKSDEKWTHLGNDDDLTNGAKTCSFSPDGVFGIHNQFCGALIHCRRFSSRRPADKEIETDAHRTHLVQRGFLRVGETTPFGFLPRQMTRNLL